MSDFKAKNSISAGAPTQTPLGELTALPNPLAGFEGLTSKGGEGKREGMRGEGREEKGGEGRGREENGGERRPFW